MRPKLLAETLSALVELNRPVCIEGAPGGGKTSIVRAVAAQLDRHYIEVHLPTMLVEDFGVPSLNEATLRYVLSDWYPAKGSRHDDGRGGVLCFDDRNQANADLQKVLANIQQARTLHGVPLADNWTVVSTGNRQSDRAGANRILSHLRNRETVIEMDTHIDDSTEWMLANNVNPLGIAFLRFRSNLLHDFDPQRDINPTPRSWVEGVFSLIGSIPASSEMEVFKGAVGEGAAAEFVAFCRVWRKLPSVDAILLNPDHGDVPTDPATLYALSGSLSSRAENGNFDRILRYTKRMPAEFNVLTVSLATKRDPALCATQAFGGWAAANGSVLF